MRLTGKRAQKALDLLGQGRDLGSRGPMQTIFLKASPSLLSAQAVGAAGPLWGGGPGPVQGTASSGTDALSPSMQAAKLPALALASS